MFLLAFCLCYPYIFRTLQGEERSITYFGPMLAYVVTGSLVVEKIFGVAGIGRHFVASITNRDYPLIMGTTNVLASLIVIMNLLSDIMYKVADPRISLE